MLKKKNVIITLKPELRMQYKVENFGSAHNDPHSNIVYSPKYNTNLKKKFK